MARRQETVTEQLVHVAVDETLRLVQKELPKATDMSLVRRVVARRVTEMVEDGESDPKRLAAKALSDVRQSLQIDESQRRIVFG